ncbi:DeoR family transcriptional regulator [Haloactinospora alba]|uniref:DeoR family transcriptional regulator n=1 Tax=Haloactinospora alba TaxID=405555 RepID=A0A543NH64_9ACTN|nr:DeoR/GlpR family DNA-binding transcription regulator [Haloactinospora alba]TQN31195.1 DeoR family transcriptional regulator [Haloactinospora alba]
MIPDQRREHILKLLQERHVLSINELTSMLSVSHMTVRRDIQALENDGRVLSVTGGVRLAARLKSEPSYLAKAQLEVPAKRAISKAASELVRENFTIFLDAGTTALQMVPMLTEKVGLTVVTNDFNVVGHLMEYPGIELIHTGGVVSHADHSSVGQFTADFLRRVNVDLAFIASSSWDVERGSTTPSEQKVVAKQQLLRIASKSVLTVDSTKYGKFGTFRVANLEEFDLIITDDRLSQSAAEAIQSRDIQLRTVSPE